MGLIEGISRNKEKTTYTTGHCPFAIRKILIWGDQAEAVVCNFANAESFFHDRVLLSKISI